MGPAGLEPATSSTPGWHHTKLDNGPSSWLAIVKLLNRRIKTGMIKIKSLSVQSNDIDNGIKGILDHLVR